MFSSTSGAVEKRLQPVVDRASGSCRAESRDVRRGQAAFDGFSSQKTVQASARPPRRDPNRSARSHPASFAHRPAAWATRCRRTARARGYAQVLDVIGPGAALTALSQAATASAPANGCSATKARKRRAAAYESVVYVGFSGHLCFGYRARSSLRTSAYPRAQKLSRSLVTCTGRPLGASNSNVIGT